MSSPVCESVLVSCAPYISSMQQVINVGTPDSGTGDTARAAGQIINANFIELYTMLETPNVVYLDAVYGVDVTGVVGNRARPFLTAQAAYNAVQAAPAGDYALKLDVGSFGGIILTTVWSKIKSITGCGSNASFLGGVSTAGAPSVDSFGVDRSVILYSNHSCHLGDISTNGLPGSDGSIGGHAGSITMKGCTTGSISGVGGAGGDNVGSAGGAGGRAATLNLYDCNTGVVSVDPGAGGTGVDPGATGDHAGFRVYNSILTGLTTTNPYPAIYNSQCPPGGFTPYIYDGSSFVTLPTF